jgi:hypothetical protein
LGFRVPERVVRRFRVGEVEEGVHVVGVVVPTAYREAAALPGVFHITVSWESPKVLRMVNPAKQ